MNGFAPEILSFLLRSTLCLTALAVMVGGLTRVGRGAAPSLQRAAWFLVLLVGVLPMRIPVRIAWYSPAQIEAGAAAREQPTDDRLASPQESSAAGLLVESGVGQPARLDRAWLLVALWLCGGGLICVPPLLGYLRLRRQAEAAVPATGEHADEWRALLRQQRVRRPLPLLIHDHLGPLLAALPGGCRVIVPRNLWNELPAAGRIAILRHELAHYQRWDVWKSLVARLLALPHWFNPFAWWAVGRFDECGEWACDRAAVAGRPEQAPAYARALLQLGAAPRLSRAYASAARGPALASRVRGLLSPCQTEITLMRKIMMFCVPLLVAAVALVRVELVAQEPAADDNTPATVESTKTLVAKLDERLKGLGESLDGLKARIEELGKRVEARKATLKAKAEDSTKFSADMQRRVELLESGDEAKQLEALKDAEALGDDGVILISAAGKDSPHAAVRARAVEAAVAIGEPAFAGVAHFYESLPSAERVALVELLTKSKLPDTLLLLVAMAKNGDAPLQDAVVQAAGSIDQGYLLIAAVGKESKDDEAKVEKLLPVAFGIKGEDGLMLLYAVAKKGRPKQQAEAVRLAPDRGQQGLAIIAAAYESKDADVRAEVVRSARKIGGEAAQYIIDHALAETDPALKEAAEKAAKE